MYSLVSKTQIIQAFDLRMTKKVIECTLEKEGFKVHYLTYGIHVYSVMTGFLVKMMIPAEKRFSKECEKTRQDSFTRIIKFVRE